MTWKEMKDLVETHGVVDDSTISDAWELSGSPELVFARRMADKLEPETIRRIEPWLDLIHTITGAMLGRIGEIRCP